MNVFEMQAEAPSRRKPSWYGLTNAVVACIDTVFAFFCLGFTVMLTIFVWERRERPELVLFPRFHDLINLFNGSGLFFLLFWIRILFQGVTTIANAWVANGVYKMSKVYPTGSLWEGSKVTKVFMWFYQGFILSCDVIEITAFVLFFKGLWGVEAPRLVFMYYWFMLCRCAAFDQFYKVVSNWEHFLPQPL